MVGSPSGCFKQDNDVIHYFSLIGKMLDLSWGHWGVRLEKGRVEGGGS